jgi:hypothetical protein
VKFLLIQLQFVGGFQSFFPLGYREWQKKVCFEGNKDGSYVFKNVHGSIGCVICWMDDEWMCECIEHDSVITQFSGSW